MPDLKEQISTARAEGYNDQQIVEYLSGKDARVKTALAEGHAAADIVAYLSGGAPAPPAPVRPSDPRARFGQGALDTGRDVAAGIGSSVWKTVFGGGDIIRRAAGMERVIDRPEVQAAMTAPSSLSGLIGNAIGTGAQVVAATPAAVTLPGLFTAGAAGGGAVAGLQSGGDPAMTAMGAVLGGGLNAAGVPVTHMVRAALKPGPGVQQAWQRVGMSLVHGRPWDAARGMIDVAKASKAQMTGGSTAAVTPEDVAQKVFDAKRLVDMAKGQVLERNVAEVAERLAAQGMTRDQIANMSVQAWRKTARENGGISALPREFVLNAMPGPVPIDPARLGFSGTTGAPAAFQAPYLPKPSAVAAPSAPPAPAPKAAPAPSFKHADKPDVIVQPPTGTTGAPVTVKGISGAKLDAQQDALVSKILDTIRKTREARPELALSADELAAAGKDQWKLLAQAAQTNLPSAAAQKRIIDALRGESGDLSGLLAESIKRAKKK